VGELLKKARVDASYEQAEIAALLGIARNTVSNYERGRSMPPLDVAVGWAEATGVSLEWLATAVVRPKGLEPLTF
jgi:transcriptional regulator with XRE-family HTH domain